MSARPQIRAALEKWLKQMDPAFPTQWEAVLYTPTLGVPYQRVNVLPATTENPTFGTGFYREVGLMSVTLFYPDQQGPGAAEARAEAIRAWFPRGLDLNEGGIQVLIDMTPSIDPSLHDGDRYVLPISIPYIANIFG